MASIKMFKELKHEGHFPTLIAAFLYFDFSFMVWTMLGPLAPEISQSIGGLTPSQISTLLSLPILGGAILRILLGFLVDNIGPKKTALISQAIVAGALWYAYFRGVNITYGELLFVAFALGFAGASFAVALPQAGQWYPPRLQGVVLGIAGAGNIGVVLDFLFAPKIAEIWGWPAVFLVGAVLSTFIMVVYFFMAKDAPIKAKKRIVTIHDVYHLAFYDTLSFKQKLYAKFMINQAVKKSDIILTVSEFSKNEIIKYTNTKKNIEVIYNAINFNKFKAIKSDFENLKDKYNLPKDFILFVGNVKPHKNLKRLLLAIKDLDINLVIVGKRDGFITGDNDISNIIKKHNLEKKVFFTGYVDDGDIPSIYNLAKLFVFPSLYEGFGIPPLEAQACGCPVVCSNVASLPEVGGEKSVIYCNPYDTVDVKEKIELVLDDEELQNDLRSRGFENIKRFSWKKSANKIIEIVKGLE